MLNLFKRKQEVVLTNEQKVFEARKSVETSLSMFSKISEDVEKANATLEAVIEEDTQRKNEIEINIKNAKAELESNKALQEKIQAFIK